MILCYWICLIGVLVELILFVVAWKLSCFFGPCFPPVLCWFGGVVCFDPYNETDLCYSPNLVYIPCIILDLEIYFHCSVSWYKIGRYGLFFRPKGLFPPKDFPCLKFPPINFRKPKYPRICLFLGLLLGIRLSFSKCIWKM